MNGQRSYRRSARKGLNWLNKNRLLKKSRLGDRDGIEQARAVDQRNQCKTAGERGAGNGSEKCVHNGFLMLFFKRGAAKGYWNLVAAPGMERNLRLWLLCVNYRQLLISYAKMHK